MEGLKSITLKDVKSAVTRINEDIIRTPLIKLEGNFGSKEIYLKLENLQSIGAFKIRGAANVMKYLKMENLINGVWTASAGNMAQGVAWYARQSNIPCSIIVPDNAPKAKLDKISKLGAQIKSVPTAEWFEVLKTRDYEGMSGHFIHPFADELVMAGNATIAVEILEDLPDVEMVIIPYGGGGLSCGIAAGLKNLQSKTKIYACEPETAAALHESFKNNSPTQIEYVPSFVDGMGAPLVFPEMWNLAKELLDGSFKVSITNIVQAVELMINKVGVIAEGAGAAPLAAALNEVIKENKIVCVISGGNIDLEKILIILNGEIPA